MTRYRFNHDTGEVEEVSSAPAPHRDAPGVSVRFRPHVSFQPHISDAQALGLERTKDKGTVFRSEKQLNEYLAREKDLGRDTAWKDT